MELKEGTVYIIRSKFNKSPKFNKSHFEGTFIRRQTRTDSNELFYRFENVICYTTRKPVYLYHYIDAYCMGDCESNLTGLFDTNNNFYDAEKVKSAKKAFQSMEKRSLDMVLKRLVNENFEW